MSSQNNGEYQKLLTEIIQKQLIYFGPSITLSKLRKIKGLKITENGSITAISAPVKEINQQLVAAFSEVSPLIVKKTILPLLDKYAETTETPKSQPVASVHYPVDPAPTQSTSSLPSLVDTNPLLTHSNST